MKIEGVTFIEAAVRGMDKEAFIRAHMAALWQDRDPKARRKMLADTYRLIAGEKDAEPESAEQAR